MKWIEGLGESSNRTFSQNFLKRIKNEDSLFYAGILPLQSLLCYNLSSRKWGRKLNSLLNLWEILSHFLTLKIQMRST